MYKNKKDVDKYVEKLLSKLSEKEFKSRAYSVARLYFEVGDYVNCQIYVEQYLAQKDNNAAAYKLLGQALQKMGQREKALEQFKISFDIDQTQTSTILDICEILTVVEDSIELGHAKYWLEKAEAIFPEHPITFRLREKLLTMSKPDPEALVKLLTMELNVRPRDPSLHARLLKHYLKTNQLNEAFNHSCKVEFSSNNFSNSYAWYEILDQVVEHNLESIDKCLYQLLLLTIKERLCLLSLTETPSGFSKNLVESADLIHTYDQSLEKVARAGPAPGFAEFHASLLQHHRGQLAFYAATLLLKRAKKGLLSWPEATKAAAPLMLIAWQVVPLDSKVNWLKTAPETQLNAVNRWYSEGTYRCSQSGHYLKAKFQNKNQTILDEISQCCSGSHWKDKLYEKLFTTKIQAGKIKSSHIASNAFIAPQLRLPRKIEVEAYDCDAQKEYGNSLHHFVWTLLNYKDYADFKCTLFDMLTPSVTSCGPETLNKLDVYAFLYCAALTTQQRNTNEILFIHGEKPNVLPANITDLLCPPMLMKWWDCAYKFSQNMLGNELTDIRATLSRGIEVVRCIDNHGLDPELLCILGRIFSARVRVTTSAEEKNHIEMRAVLYYGSAIPLLEKQKGKMMITVSDKRLFDYTHKELGTKQLNALLEESKLYVAVNHINESEYEKAIELLVSVKSQQAYYHLAQAYKKVASEERYSSTDASKSKYEAMLLKAKNYAYKALDSLKEDENNLPLYSDTQELIEDIEICINKVNPNLSNNDIDGRYSSDENISYRTDSKRTNANMFRNISSTPKASSNQNNTNYRTAIDTEILETTRVNQRNFERIENEIKNLQKKDTTITDFMEQTKYWFEENRNLGNRIINTINSNIQNTTDQFKQLKISVDQVKDQIDECRTECQDVGEMKKQIAELRKEVLKLKKTSSEQTINENDLYSLDDDFRTNDTTSNYGSQLPFTPQMLPTFNQRQPFQVPPNPYQLYNQTLFNLYNQYSQFAQAPVTGAQPLFDPTRAPMNYPGVYPTPDQMFLDMAHLIPPAPAPATAPTGVPPPTIPPAVHTVPVAPAAPLPVPIVTTAPITTTVFSSKSTSSTTTEFKDASRTTIPANVVITSAKPLPTTAPTSAPILSVTIPQKHKKSNQPHNYQIAMPTATDSDVSSPAVFSFTMPDNKNNPTSSLLNWNKAFQTLNNSDTSYETSKSVVDGPFSGSPNTSLNKSRTLSEKSNTSVENYDPCPDFKPIIPLPEEVKVTTGEEDETIIFSSRAKLFRFTEKQWKERGLGEMKLLKHTISGRVRVLMRREQVHKVCANHIITPEMEINPMKNETKAYIWVANDFAEETVVLEKFCIRFKTADIAHQFYETFENARKESENLVNKTEVKPTQEKPESKIITTSFDKTVKGNTSESATASAAQGKTVVGGFTFSSTPIFKPMTDDNKPDIKKTEPEANKTSVFSNLTFKTGASTPFNNIFNTTPTPATQASKVEPIKDSSIKSKLDTSDAVEEFEPTAEFKPVIALPALVETKTGEEDEVVLFEHRAKLLRYDSTTKEWKERGLGSMKLLQHKDNDQKVRLLMRREQIKKVCCNHVLTKEMIFQKMTNVDKAVTWCAKDFSEGELVAETFCLRFKTAQICDDFINTVQAAQQKIKVDAKNVKETENASKQTAQAGFGDKFKPKAGSWCCQACYTNNLETYSKCVCCLEPNPQAIKINNSKADISTEPPKTSGWGDMFKPKVGSWECQTCLVRNEASVENCSSCDSPKDPMSKKAMPAAAPNIKVNFSFGIPQQTASSIQDQSKSINILQIPIKSEPTPASTVKFSFGIPPTQTNKEKPESIFEGTGASNFSFGIPSMTSTDQKPTAIIYAAPKIPTKPDGPLNFSLKKEDSQTASNTEPSNSFAGKDSGFGFVFKAGASKSPAKSPHKQGEESDADDTVEEEDCSAHFNPVVPLPEKVDVVTGEEHEEELYAHRARLYIYVSGEWKERGTGIVKILKHKETRKLRVVMRREQVLKICLNHALTSEIAYNVKDEKTWIFAANDFSEGELTLQKFCLRFSNKEIATNFKNAVDNAIAEKPVEEDVGPKALKFDQDADDDVVFVKQTQSNEEDKQKAKHLLLPENFYMYKDKEPCRGCRGCSDDDAKSDTKPKTITVSEVAAALAKENAAQASLVTPMKAKLPVFQSPALSMYGTPGNDKTFDNSIFRTPLGSIGSNTVSSTPSNNISDAEDNAPDKENIFTQKSSIFSNFSDQKSIFGTPQNTPAPLFGAGDTPTPVSTKSSLIAPPKLSALNVSSESQAPEAKSIFSSYQAKPSFGESSVFGSAAGMSSNKSKFGFSFDKPKDESSAEVKSIFGGNTAPVNLFSGSSQGSIFGTGSLNTNLPKPGAFGTSASSLFGAAAANAMNDAKTETNKFSTIWGPIPSEQNPVAELPLKLENNLSFAALSTEAGAGFEKKADFKWEGSGQQIFTSGQKESSVKNKSSEGDDTGEGEDFDPHYEPIVPLPDEIVVTTGEEDEKIIFSERGKLYRYDDKNKEWKERGVGALKILHHPQRNTYRLLLRREQVHKAVLNMLLHIDINLLPMKNTETAWTFAGRNYAESTNGLHEMLAVRFKNAILANSFRDQVNQCIRSLQAAAATAIREKKEAQEKKTTEVVPVTTVNEETETKEAKLFSAIAPLRLPKHLQDNARADMMFTAPVQQESVKPAESLWATAHTQSQQADSPQNNTPKPNGDSKESTPSRVSQVHFQEPEEDEDEDDEEDYDEENAYENYPNEYYYGGGVYYEREAEVIIEDVGGRSACPQANVQVFFDSEVYMPKIVITDPNGEILADMPVQPDIRFDLDGVSCKWTGADYTSNTPVDKSITLKFHDSASANTFYDSVVVPVNDGEDEDDDEA